MTRIGSFVAPWAAAGRIKSCELMRATEIQRRQAAMMVSIVFVYLSVLIEIPLGSEQYRSKGTPLAGKGSNRLGVTCAQAHEVGGRRETGGDAGGLGVVGTAQRMRRRLRARGATRRFAPANPGLVWP